MMEERLGIVESIGDEYSAVEDEISGDECIGIKPSFEDVGVNLFDGSKVLAVFQ